MFIEEKKECLVKLDLVVCNAGDKFGKDALNYTLTRFNSCITPELSPKIIDWGFLVEESRSDHHYIGFTVGFTGGSRKHSIDDNPIESKINDKNMRCSEDQPDTTSRRNQASLPRKEDSHQTKPEEMLE